MESIIFRFYLSSKRKSGDEMDINRKHLEEIQYARAIALFAVFAVHSSSQGVVGTPSSSIAFGIYNFFNIAGKLGTPTFIFLSSFILFYTYYHRNLTVELFKKFYKKRMIYILVPYLFFSIFYFGLGVYLNNTPVSLLVLMKTFLVELFTGKAYPHLYFVFVSVQFYLMFPFLLYLFKRYSFIRKNAILIGIIIQWAWVFANSYFFQVPSKGSISLSYFMFYFFGAFLGIYYEKASAWILNWKKHLPGILAVFTLYGFFIYFYVRSYYLLRTNQKIYDSMVYEFAWSTHAFFAGASIFILVHLLRFRKLIFTKKLLTELGAVSFGMYLIHPLFLLVLRRILSSGEPLVFHGWQLLSLIITFFASWLVVRIVYDFLPYSWVIFGKGNKVLGQVKL